MGVFSPFLGLMSKCMFSLPFFGSVFDLVKLLVKKQILNISKKLMLVLDGDILSKNR